MTARRKPGAIAPISLQPPCSACGKMHRLEDCDTEDAAALLDAAGFPMSAHKVRARIGGGA